VLEKINYENIIKDFIEEHYKNDVEVKIMRPGDEFVQFLIYKSKCYLRYYDIIYIIIVE
jgi:hypothetical protein